MTEESVNKDENIESKVNQDDNLDVENFVQLTPQQYSAMLERINELETDQKGKSKVYNLDDLAEEGKRKPGQSSVRQPTKDLDEMSRLELAQYVVNVIGDHFTPIANELQVQIQTMKVAQEIDRAASKYSDFWDLHEDVLRIGTENPSLSIEKAYKLAKAERGETPSKKSPKEQTLLTLPPKPLLGDRPNSPSRKSTTPRVMSLEEAAETAWDKLGVKEPE